MTNDNFTEGYFIISRSIFRSAIWDKPPEYRIAFFYLIGRVNHEHAKYRGYKIERGQCLLTIAELQEELSYTIGFRRVKSHASSVKRMLKWMREEGMIRTMRKPRGILISLLNYDQYQTGSNYERTREQTTERTTSESRPNAEQSSINKKEKNEKNKKTPFKDEKIWNTFVRFLKNQKNFEKAEGLLWSRIKKYGVDAVEKACKAIMRSQWTSIGAFDEQCEFYRKKIDRDAKNSLPDL